MGAVSQLPSASQESLSQGNVRVSSMARSCASGKSETTSALGRVDSRGPAGRPDADTAFSCGAGLSIMG